MAPVASVVLLTRNGMPLVRDCLDAVLRQETPWSYEVIVIDSESTDGTWELLDSLEVVRVRIAPREFSHGGTRNLGASMARGEFVVFLVQDAVPADQHWLRNLVSAANAPGIAGAYSRQLVRPGSNLITRYLSDGTTPTSLVRGVQALGTRSLAELDPRERFRISLFQDASSCVRKSVWAALPFSTVPYGEDMDWGKRVIEAGYGIVFEPTSAVYHSHERSPLYALKRAYADHYLVTDLFELVLIPSLSRMVRAIVSSTCSGWRFIWRHEDPLGTRLALSLSLPLFTTALAAGQYIGARFSRWLPASSTRDSRPRRVRATSGPLQRIDHLLRRGV
jgi:rhamnosyltransferase